MHKGLELTLLHISLNTLVITSILGLKCGGTRRRDIVDTYFHASLFSGTIERYRVALLLCPGEVVLLLLTNRIAIVVHSIIIKPVIDLSEIALLYCAFNRLWALAFNNCNHY